MRAYYPFVSNAPFLYPQKTENLTVVWCFQGVMKGCIGSKWVNDWQICYKLSMAWNFVDNLLGLMLWSEIFWWDYNNYCKNLRTTTVIHTKPLFLAPFFMQRLQPTEAITKFVIVAFFKDVVSWQASNNYLK